MAKHKTVWIVVLSILLVLFGAMFYIGTLGMDKMGQYTLRIK